MTKLFSSLFAAALVLGLCSAPTLTYAEDPVEEAEEMDEASGGETTSEGEAPEDPVEEAEEGE